MAAEAAVTTVEIAASEDLAFDQRDIKILTDIVRARAGIVLGEHKKSMMYSRLVRRVKELGLHSFSSYCSLLISRDGEAEIDVMLNCISTNLTSFFRESHHFTHLRNNVFKPLVESARKGGRKRIRIWSAGCSTGEEPYSIAMVMHASIRDLSRWNARILAIDLDTNVLKTARSGTYREADTHNIPPSLKERFLVEGSEYGDVGRAVMHPDLKKLISFKRLNLLEDWPFAGPFDAIFCRNVMIYFDGETRRKLVEGYHDKLRPDGFLYIGHSESLAATDQFKLHDLTVHRRLQ